MVTRISFDLTMSRRIIFQHIPKTAGSSLQTLFTSQFDRQRTFICGSQDGVLQDFLQLETDQRDRLDLLIGHVDFGVHQQFSDESTYISFIREPVERVLSHYYFIRDHVHHRYHAEANMMKLEEFMSSGIRPRMNNCMTRMFSGENPQYNACNFAMVEKALDNIDQQYGFIGFFSTINSSVDSLVKIMGWKNITLERKNVTRNKPQIQHVSQEIIDLIRYYNSYDIELYKILRNRFMVS